MRRCPGAPFWGDVGSADVCVWPQKTVFVCHDVNCRPDWAQSQHSFRTLDLNPSHNSKSRRDLHRAQKMEGGKGQTSRGKGWGRLFSARFSSDLLGLGW